MNRALEMAARRHSLQRESFLPQLLQDRAVCKCMCRSALSRYMVRIILPNFWPRTGKLSELNASVGERTSNTTMRTAPTNEPALLPMGRTGTAGKSTSTHHVAKAKHPRMTFCFDAHAISEILPWRTYTVKLSSDLQYSLSLRYDNEEQSRNVVVYLELLRV